jgi:alpha-beta hydrolase superfamily lysophospholipase
MGKPDEFEVTDADGLTSVVLRWLPDGPPRAVVQVLHGWA